MTKIVAPSGLGAKSKRLWSEVTGSYELRSDELRLLEDACREVDIVERLEDEFRGAPSVVRGSMGQDAASPLLQELRAHRVVIARLLGMLKLPDEDASRPRLSTSDAARKAANARWSRTTDRGA